MPKHPPEFEIEPIDPATIAKYQGDPEALMRALIHDCPECRAAMERGEQPQFGVLPELPPRRSKRWPSPGRWRNRKRG